MYEEVLEWWSKLDQKDKDIILNYLKELETKKNKIMSLSIKGRISNILEIEEGVSKADKPWKKQGFVIDTGAQYNPEVCFQMFGEEKIEMLKKFAEGEEVDVAFNLSSREFNGKYYHNIDAWKINSVGEAGSTAPAIDDAPAEDDDLPF